jgi:hypothetical protein
MSVIWGGGAVVAVTDAGGLRDYRRGVDTPTPRWPWLVLLAFLLGIAFGVQLHAAEPCVQLQVRPALMLRLGTIEVQTHVRRHEDHRSFDLRWTSDVGSSGSSGPTPLEGEHAQAVFTLPLKDQPAANYTFEARVFDSVGRQLGSARAQIHAPEVSH